MILTDTHTHLYVEQFDDDRNDIMARAEEEGVHRFFIPAIDSTYYERMKSLRNNYPESVHLMAGLHPTHVNENVENELEVVLSELKSGSYVAIGEIGMDLYWDTTFKEQQEAAFRKQIQWAKDLSLPIAIHCRNAFDEIFAVMDDVRDDQLTGVFHCFTGDKDQAVKALDYGFYLGIGGVATFKNGGIDKYLAEIDLGRILLETDAPYLAPVPYRGKRNESSYLKLVAQKLADIYSVDIEQIADVTTANSKKLFGI